MAKNYKSVHIESDLHDLIFTEGLKEIYRLHPELKGMYLTKSFILRRIVTGWLKL